MFTDPSIGTDVMSLAAVVAAYVGVIKTVCKGTKIEPIANKLAPVLALAIATLFVLVPSNIQHTILLISVIGLSAVGAYHLVKPSPTGNDVNKTK